MSRLLGELISQLGIEVGWVMQNFSSGSEIRRADFSELRTVFMMGFDTWSDGSSADHYLDACSSSPKYAKGTWFVLEDRGVLVSSLIVYPLQLHLVFSAVGIGSIATSPELRGRGYAGQLLSGVISQYEADGQVRAFVLYSDIDPTYYQRFGFRALPATDQRHTPAVCMIRCDGETEKVLFSSGFKIPSYF